jgi:hypothetical protein
MHYMKNMENGLIIQEIDEFRMLLKSRFKTPTQFSGDDSEFPFAAVAELII